MQSQKRPEEESEENNEFIKSSDSTLTTKKIAVAGVLAALSVAVAPVVAFIPRIPGWGIALFDPVSIFWIIAFLIGGFVVGMASMTVGTIALFFYDPTGPIGTLLKLIATVPMIIIPWLGVKLGDKAAAGRKLGNVKRYVTLMIVATIVRLIIMIPLNLIIVPLFFGLDDTAFLIAYTVVLNVVQAFWDITVPYVVVHPTSLFDEFGLW